MAGREFLPNVIIACHICIVVQNSYPPLSSVLCSFCHRFMSVNLRMTEQPTLMEAPTPSHIAEEWYLGLKLKWFCSLHLFGLTLMMAIACTRDSHGHRCVDSVLSGDSTAKGCHVAPHVESWMTKIVFINIVVIDQLCE